MRAGAGRRGGLGLQDGTVRFWDAAGSGAAPLCEFTAHASAGLGTAGLGVRRRGASSARGWRRPRRLRPRVAVAAGRRRRRRRRRRRQRDGAEPAHSFQAGGAAAVARLAPPGDGEPQLATGGRGVDLAVWSVATGQPAWRARNVPHDELRLAVPVWVADARWLPGTPQTLVVGTGFVKERLRGEVRLYDVRAQRRPVLRTHAPAGEEAVSAVACTADGLHVVAGSVSGTLVRLDVRGGMRAAGRYKGAAGSIREVAAAGGAVACVGLDRMLRVYGAADGALRKRVYLKQRLTALLWGDGGDGEGGGEGEGEGEEEDVEAMLSTLPQVGEAEGEAEGEEEEEEEEGEEEEEVYGGGELD